MYNDSDNTRSQQNPMLPLLDQLTSLAKQQQGVPVVIDYDHLVRCVVQVFREEWTKAKHNPKVIISQAEAYTKYNRSVVQNLVRRGRLQQYRFECREVEDEDGNIYRTAKGCIYYRVAEIEQAIEEGNLYRGLKRTRKL